MIKEFLDLTKCFLIIDNMSFLTPSSIARAKPLFFLVKLTSDWVQIIFVQHVSKQGFQKLKECPIFVYSCPEMEIDGSKYFQSK